MDEHPGPLVLKKPVSVPSDFVLLQRMQDVNISLDETPSEYYVLREVYDDSADFLFEANVNTEEELYVKGTTAVWTKGTTTNGDEAAAPHVCLTCETSIKFAFFCPERFLSSECSENEKDNTRPSKGSAPKSAVCLVDGTTLKVHCDNGENFITSIECPVSNVWVTKHGILLEKESSSTLLDIHSVPLPRLFSLTHPLDEMCPVIIKMSGSVSYITETEYRVVFSCEHTDLVLMFDEKTGKHFICFLRKASEDEKNSVGCVNDSECFSNSAFTSSINLSQPATPLPAAMTTPQSFYKTSRKLSLKKCIQTDSWNFYLIIVLTRHSASTAGRPSLGATFCSPYVSNVGQMGQSFNLSVAGIANRSNIATNQSQLAGTGTTPLSRLQSTMGGTSTSLLNVRKIGQAEPSKPIVPEYCLEHVWTEHSNTWK